MEEVYRSAGTTKELKELLRVQELEVHPQGERVIAWMYSCDSLINTFSIKKCLPISVIESKNKVKSRTEEKPWFNRTLRNQKNQVSRELKKVLKAVHWGRKSDDTRLSELRAKYKKNCWMAKQSYHEDLWIKLLMSNKQKNNKRFWELINGLTKGKKSTHECRIVTGLPVFTPKWISFPVLSVRHGLIEHHLWEDIVEGTLIVRNPRWLPQLYILRSLVQQYPEGHYMQPKTERRGLTRMEEEGKETQQDREATGTGTGCPRKLDGTGEQRGWRATGQVRRRDGLTEGGAT
ncbi:hypothetical protein NDU88_004817 [Pleurodeles waltl]|uniref:Uncharacterized protein n=1 Tax=Pleurodeles waltl TaxID=8319 RepID=A0AAV7MF27_PLEWA|nr:hypothetical protein NDU88_004817 [Pleurodeles waltl]